MPDKTKISTTHAAQTTKINNGNVAVKQVIVKKPPKPLFVLFAYGVNRNGSGDRSFLYAAEFKKERLEKKYPNAEIRIIKWFKYPSHFKAEWAKLYKELTNPETANKYALWQIHYFGHGGNNSLYLEHEGGIKGANSEIFFNKSDNMARLPWHPDKGIFVLHSCRGGAYEDSHDQTLINAKICLANIISKQQNTRCLGQTIYANFAIDVLKIHRYSSLSDRYNYSFAPELKTTAEEDAERFKYRCDRFTNRYYSGTPIDRVLWGYALLYGKTESKMMKNKKEYEEAIKKPYPIYEEMKKLDPKNQILPCRVFNRGVLEKRIVEVDVFNRNDMEYI